MARLSAENARYPLFSLLRAHFTRDCACLSPEATRNRRHAFPLGKTSGDLFTLKRRQPMILLWRFHTDIQSSYPLR